MRVEGEGYDVVCMILFKVPVALCAIFLWQTLFVFEWGGGGVKMIQTHECNMGLKSSTPWLLFFWVQLLQVVQGDRR